MNKPLTITSPTNVHALVGYAGIAVLGTVHVLIGPPDSLSLNLGEGLASLLMTALVMSGLSAFTAAMIASRRSDPTRALKLEMVTLGFLTAVLGITLWSVLRIYGLGSISTEILLAIPTFGCLGRLIQAGVELRKVGRARRQQLSTVEVLEDPTKE